MRAHRPQLSALLAVLLAPYAIAQSPPSPGGDSGRLAYTGDTTRAAIGWDSDNRFRGELWHVLAEDERTAWIGEMWITDRSAGGAKLSHHWRSDDAGVRKLFGAFDQNRWHDRKVTLGLGYETERWFASGYVSAGVTGRREVAFDQSSSTRTIRGDDNGRPYEQDVTTTLITRTFERAYDWGVGARVGHFYPEPLVRVEAGLDYERGDNASGQVTLSLGAEKFFAGTPHSIAIAGEAYRKHGGLEPDRDDARVWLAYRYAFGATTAWRPERGYRMVEVPRAAPAMPPPAAVAPVAAVPASAPMAAAQPRVEKRIVKTTATASADAFFDLDRATLKPEAKAALDTAIAKIRSAGFEGNIRVAGHTCDLGSDAYNLKLSQRRADVVRDYLVAQGLPAARVLAEGMGEAAPRYANTREQRAKNRRVDIEFVTFEEKVESVTIAVPAPPVPPPPAAAPAAPPASVPAPAVEWRREEIATEPSWLRRALRNTSGHKQSVDVYRTKSETTTVAEGPKRYLNRAPLARNDTATIEADAAAVPIAVLANDSDPDGDPLTLASVGAPAHGTATISGGQVLYTPARGYTGSDGFTYTVGDGNGGSATATVEIAVVRTNRAPVATDDYAVAGYNRPVDIDVLANDSDPDGDRLTVVSFTQPQLGAVTRGPGNTLTYRSAPNYIGYESFTYEVADGKGGTARASVVVFADP